MLKSLTSFIGSPLTKYMGIAIVVLIGALSSAVYLSYKFYGEREVAVAANEQLSVTVKDEKKQTNKALKSVKLIDEAVVNVRQGEKKLDKATQRLQEEISTTTPNNPTGESNNENTDPCGDFLDDADIGLLKKSHCLTDGDSSDCNF